MAQITPIKLSQSNAFLVRGEKNILIDTGVPADTKRLTEALQTHGVLPSDLSLVVLTHGHGDHAGGLAGLRGQAGITIFAGGGDAEILKRGKNGPLKPQAFLGRVLQKYYENFHWPTSDNGAPSIDTWIDQETRLNPWGISGSLIPTPGHTSGSISLILDSGEALIGDLLSGGYLGGLILPKKPILPLYAENKEAIAETVRGLLQRGVKRFYVGHGGPLEAGAVKAWLARQE